MRAAAHQLIRYDFDDHVKWISYRTAAMVHLSGASAHRLIRPYCNPDGFPTVYPFCYARRPHTFVPRAQRNAPAECSQSLEVHYSARFGVCSHEHRRPNSLFDRDDERTADRLPRQLHGAVTRKIVQCV